MTHPNGRRPLSVNQGPTNGTHYPFVCPSDDVSLLLTDAYLSYEDRECGFVRPFRIAWLYGFGTDAAVTPAFAPSPTHARDLLILDANDNVVFDSTVAGSFVSVDWPITSPRAKVLEWKAYNAVARVTWHTEFGPNDDIKTYSVSFEPDNGQLDARVADRRSPRVTSLRVGITTFGPDEIVRLISGYNIEQQVAAFGTAGGRKGQRIAFSAEPGGGKGQFPGCEDPDIVIRRINGVQPQENGNFLLDATGCYAIRQPTTLLTNPVPGPNATPYVALAAESTLQAFNDCKPCCDCPDYIRTYEGLRSLAKKYELLGDRAEAVRDQHRLNISRWESDKACRESNKCRASIFTRPDLAAVIAGSLCQFSDVCEFGQVLLRFQFAGPLFSYRSGSGFRSGYETKGRLEQYVPAVVPCTEDCDRAPEDDFHTEVRFFFENSTPYVASTAQFTLDFFSAGTVVLRLLASFNKQIICSHEVSANLLP